MCAWRNYAQARSQRYPNLSPNVIPLKRTYFFKDEFAFTEDNILIKKLYLFNVAPELSSKQLEAYFTKFGPVGRLQVFGPVHVSGSKYRGLRHKTKTGYIFFVDPTSAAKALRRTVHYVGKRRLCVQPSDSWHQPDALDQSGQSLASTPNDPPAPIMMLNDHCLEHILRLLSVPDRIRFARTCVRFQNVYEQVSPSLDKCVKFEDFSEMTVWDLRDFFKLSGPFIKQLEGIIPQRHSKRIFEFLGTNCINLQKLSITACKITERNMVKTFEKMTQLQNLRLCACELSNDSLLALAHLPELKNLDLSNNVKLTGVNMVRLPKSIESLTLTSCTFLKSKLLAKVCSALKHLKELHLKGIYTIGTAFKQMAKAKCCKGLETISVSNGSGLGFSPYNQYEHIARLPAIKHIIVHSNEGDRLRPELLAELANFKSKQLQRLEIRGENCINSSMLLHISKLTALRTLVLPNNNTIVDRGMEMLRELKDLEEINLKYCQNVTDSAVLRLIFACPKLKILHLDYCPQLSGKLLSDIIYRMRIEIKQGSERPLPIKINVYGCYIDEGSLHNVEVDAKDIIDLSYSLPKSSDLCFFDMAELLDFDDDVDFSDGELDRADMFDVGFLSDEYDFDDLADSDEYDANDYFVGNDHYGYAYNPYDSDDGNLNWD